MLVAENVAVRVIQRAALVEGAAERHDAIRLRAREAQRLALRRQQVRAICEIDPMGKRVGAVEVASGGGRDELPVAVSRPPS